MKRCDKCGAFITVSTNVRPCPKCGHGSGDTSDMHSPVKIDTAVDRSTWK